MQAPLSDGEPHPDQDLIALPAPPRQERVLTVVLMLATAVASLAMLWALRGEVAYALSTRAPLELGELGQATPTAGLKNRYVRATGLLSSGRAIRYERPMEGDSFRLAPLASNPGVWVEIRVPEGMEGPKFAPPTTFVGRLVPFSEAGIRHVGLAQSVARRVVAAGRRGLAEGVAVGHRAGGAARLFRRLERPRGLPAGAQGRRRLRRAAGHADHPARRGRSADPAHAAHLPA
jgi:hypothetical protein